MFPWIYLFDDLFYFVYNFIAIFDTTENRRKSDVFIYNEIWLTSLHIIHRYFSMETFKKCIYNDFAYF